MQVNLMLLSVILAGAALVSVEASERHPMGVMRRRFDWVFDDPDFWTDFEEWRRERIERGRNGDGNTGDRKRDGKSRDRRSGRNRRDRGDRDDRMDRDRPEYPETTLPPEEIQIIPAPTLILSTSSYPMTTPTPTPTYVPTVITSKQKKLESPTPALSVAYTTVPESTVYTSVTGRLRAMSNSAGSHARSGEITFVLLVLGSALMAAVL